MSNDSQPQIAKSMRLFNEALKKSAEVEAQKMVAFGRAFNDAVVAAQSDRA